MQNPDERNLTVEVGQELSKKLVSKRVAEAPHATEIELDDLLAMQPSEYFFAGRPRAATCGEHGTAFGDVEQQASRRPVCAHERRSSTRIHVPRVCGATSDSTYVSAP